MHVGAVFRVDAPDYLNVRKAARAAIVAPLVLAIGEFVFDNDTLALYAVLASIVALVFADYGGPMRRRAGAYVTMILLGSLMIALGAALSSLPVAAVIGMFAVGFAASLMSSLGGYAPLHVSGVALAYSLSVLQPLAELGVTDRIAGWALGGGTAMVAALTCWPVERRTGLRNAAAELCGDTAATLRSRDAESFQHRLEELHAQVTALQQKMTTPLRPFGAAAHDIALFHLIIHVTQAVDLVDEMAQPIGGDGRSGSVDAPLRDEIADALDRAQAVLVSERPPESEAESVERLGRSLAAGRQRVEDLVAHVNQDDVGVAMITEAVPLRALSHLTIWIEFEAARSVGRGDLVAPRLAVAPEVSSAAPPPDLRSTLRRVISFVRWELDPDGVVTRNSVRTGAALAAAVLLAEVLDVEHGFWVVLAALLVLRSSAASTSANALAAVVGTLAGFVLVVGIIDLAGDATVVLWLVFPVAVFFSGYTPGTLGVGFGQATFAVNVIVLFALTDAPGVPTALIRVEDVTLGALTAALLSMVIWPRGARAALARAVATSYRTAAEATATFVDGTREARRSAEGHLTAARRRAEAALDLAVTEHGEPIAMASWVSVLRPLALVRALVVGLVPTIDVTGGACAPAVAEARSEAAALGVRLERTAEALASASTDAMRDAARPDPIQAPYEHCIGERRGDVDRLFDAVALVAWSWFIAQTGRDLDTADDDIRAVVMAADPHTWLVGARS